MAHRWGWRWLCRGMTLAVLLGTAANVRAHEPAVTRVSIRIGVDGRVEVRIPAIPSALVPLLEPERGRDPGALAAGSCSREGAPCAPAPTGDEATFLARQATWLNAVSLKADGVALPLSFRWERGDPGGSLDEARGTIVLDGRLPAGARELVWQYAIPLGSYPIQVTAPGGKDPFVVWAVGDRESAPITFEMPSTLTLATQYLGLGVVHIVPRGIDHILFVLGLFLLQRAWRPLLTQVSAFTVAHTLTLGASIAGLVAVPAAVVEPLIAASVAWVAIENVWRTSVSRARVGAVFLCGLLHGLGFAGVLADLGLPVGARAVALLSFNAGVEVGQVSVLACAFLATWWLAADSRRYRHWVVVPASLVIAAVGIYWTLERLGAVA